MSSSGRANDDERNCKGPLGHRLEVKGTFWQATVGFIRLAGKCRACGKHFVVPVVRDMDREVTGTTPRVRLSKPVRKVEPKEED